MRHSILVSLGVGVLCAAPLSATVFAPGSLVVSVSGNGVIGAASGSYTDNEASPLTLFDYTTSGKYLNSLVLPQTSSGANSAISAEYGSSSEGTIQLSGNGKYLTVVGYGVNAATFNANPTAYGTTTTGSSKSTALAQSGSLTGQGYTPVARVVALIGANGSVDTTTALIGVFNGNNPRSAYTVDGKTIYVSGQGTGKDSTGGVFYATKGSTTAASITGNDTSGKTLSQDTRDVQIVNGQLVVSTDSKGGSGNARDFVGTLGASGSLPTSVANNSNGPTMLPGFGNSGGTGKVTITSSTGNGVNAAGQEINLSPESFYYANATTLYVADSGSPKNDSVSKDGTGSSLGDGGLQKWSLVNGTWSLDYTLSEGLNLVSNAATSGTTGLFALAGKVVGDEVELFATNYTIGDLDQTYLFGLTDDLTATTKTSDEAFLTLATAPADSNFKGVAFAPDASAVPEPATYGMMTLGFGMLGGMLRGRRRYRQLLA